MADRPSITITDLASRKFQEIARAEGRAGHGLRVSVSGGGTVRPQVALNFVGPEEARGDDITVDASGLVVHIDPSSARWLDDAKIDFIDGLDESGFKVDTPKAGIPTPTGPVAEAVQKVLVDKINPAVASHGGHVSLVAIDGETAYLQFGGGCQGCGMVNVTLKQGVERILFEDVPQITRVLDVTDHAAGTNPYYQPSK
jgi:Fe/S biogenesis protein NfuA